MTFRPYDVLPKVSVGKKQLLFFLKAETLVQFNLSEITWLVSDIEMIFWRHDIE